MDCCRCRSLRLGGSERLEVISFVFESPLYFKSKDFATPQPFDLPGENPLQVPRQCSFPNVLLPGFQRAD